MSAVCWGHDIVDAYKHPSYGYGLPVCPLRELSALRVFAHCCESGGYVGTLDPDKLEQFFALALWVRYL